MRLFKWSMRWGNSVKKCPCHKISLPEQFDVVCNVDLENRSRSIRTLEIPGNLYVSGNLHNWKIKVSGDLFVDGNIDNADCIEVGGDLCVLGNIFASHISSLVISMLGMSKLVDEFLMVEHWIANPWKQETMFSMKNNPKRGLNLIVQASFSYSNSNAPVYNS